MLNHQIKVLRCKGGYLNHKKCYVFIGISYEIHTLFTSKSDLKLTGNRTIIFRLNDKLKSQREPQIHFRKSTYCTLPTIRARKYQNYLWLILNIYEP